MIFTTDPAYASLALRPDPDQQAEDAQLYRRVLHKLIHIGAGLADILQAHATAHAHAAAQGLAPPEPTLDHAAAFDRIARAVRRTITLARSLTDPPAPARAGARTPAPHGAGQGAAGHPAAAPGHDDSAAGAKAPSAGLRDRPEAPDRDAPDRDDDDTGRPPAAVIADIRRDLGLDTPPGADAWTHGTPSGRTPADTKPPCTQAAAPSSAAAGSTGQPGPLSQGLRYGAAQHSPAPDPDGHDPDGHGPDGPTATPRAQPAPVQSGGALLPDDPAEAGTMVLHHAARAQGARWRPPSEI